MSRGWLIGLIGAGIGPSLSPALHEREAGHHGLRYLYRLIDTDVLGIGLDDAGEVVRAARRLGYDGLNVTHPFKQAVIPFLDELSPDAAALGAVNTVTFTGGRAVGHNTDWTGFADAFRRGLPDAELDKVVQLGSGGAGAAVGYALLTGGAGQLTVVDVLPRRAQELAGRLAALFGEERVRAAGPAELDDLMAKADGLVHATPTGMAAHPGLPLPAELLRAEQWIAEVVYRPLETDLVRAARVAGCRVLDGGGMAVGQAAHSFRLFTGIEPDTDRMLAHLAELI